jgi:hypothetical protein
MEGTMNAQDVLIFAALTVATDYHNECLENGKYDEYEKKYRHYKRPEAPKLEDFLTEYDTVKWGEVTDALYGNPVANGYTFEHDGQKHFVKELDQFGGEGQGDGYYHIYEVDGKTYKLDAYYASWDGVHWDDAELFEVKPKEVKVIQWVKV